MVCFWDARENDFNELTSQLKSDGYSTKKVGADCLELSFIQTYQDWSTWRAKEGHKYPQ